MREGGKKREQRIDLLYRLVLARPPKPDEMQVVLDTLDGFEARYRADKKSAEKFLAQGASPRAKMNARELAAYASIASVILNLDETVTKQ
jgi:hypothetical protein